SADEVALHQAIVAAYQDAVAGIAGDDVARPGGCAPDGVGERVAKGALDCHAIAPVADGLHSGGIRADEVALNQVVLTGDRNAIAGIAGDDVAGPGLLPADRIAPGRNEDPHPVGDGFGAGRINANEVPLYEGPRCADDYADPTIAGDEIPG